MMPAAMIVEATDPLRRCPQCWKRRAEGEFVKTDGTLSRLCLRCKERYRGWTSLPLVEKLARIGPRVDQVRTNRVVWAPKSGNRKLGGIPSSISERASCPPSCSLYDAGCYADYGHLGHHWRQTTETGLSWTAFLDAVRSLPEGQLWRHNEAGDLAGTKNRLDIRRLNDLVEANRGRRGFTFTHRTTRRNYNVLREANRSGFTINLSADSLEEADTLCGSAGSPVVVLLSHDAPSTGIRTPAGRRVVVCPAQTHEISCATCQLCAKAHRKAIVGFRAHGQFRQQIGALVQLRRKAVPRGS